MTFSIPGVAFLKAVTEGTYDAIIVDSSDPIGNASFGNFVLFICFEWFSIFKYLSHCLPSKVLHKSSLRSPFLSWWQRLFVQVEWSVLRQKVSGYICT